MTRLYLKLLIILISLTLVLSACKKEEDDDPNPDDSNPSADTNPNIYPGMDADAVATLTALESIKQVYVDNVYWTDFTTNSLAGLFWAPANQTDYLSVNAVSGDGNELQADAQNLYLPSPFNPVSLEQLNEIEWIVDGDNGIPSFTDTNTHYLPIIDSISTTAPFTPGQDLEINYHGVDNTSMVVLVQVKDKAGQFYRTYDETPLNGHTVPGSATEDINPNDYEISAMFINYTKKTFDGKKVYFVSQRQIRLVYEPE